MKDEKQARFRVGWARDSGGPEKNQAAGAANQGVRIEVAGPGNDGLYGAIEILLGAGADGGDIALCQQVPCHPVGRVPLLDARRQAAQIGGDGGIAASGEVAMH